MLRKNFLLTALLLAQCCTTSMAQYSVRKKVNPGQVIAYESFSFAIPRDKGVLQKIDWSFDTNSMEEVVMFTRPNSPEFMLRKRLGDGSVSWLATVTMRKPRGAVSAADYMEKWVKGVKFKPYPTPNDKNSCVEVELIDDTKTGKEGFFLTGLLCFKASTDQIIDLSFSELNTLLRPPDENFKKAAVDLFASFKLR